MIGVSASALGALPAGALASGDWADAPAAPAPGVSSLSSAVLRARITEVTDEEMDEMLGETRGGLR